jgi:hypothetical protein
MIVWIRVILRWLAWFSGAHMGLGENRRQKLGYEIESSFWILKIRRNAAVKEVKQ